MIGIRPGIWPRIKMDSRGTRTTFKPVMNPLLDAEVKANPHV